MISLQIRRCKLQGSAFRIHSRQHDVSISSQVSRAPQTLAIASHLLENELAPPVLQCRVHEIEVLA
jgi:hypothetical protein